MPDARSIHVVEQGAQGSRIHAALAAAYFNGLKEEGIPVEVAVHLTGKWITAMTLSISLERAMDKWGEAVKKWIDSA